MDITVEQAKFLINFAGKIQENYGVIIGFNNVQSPNVDFLVVDLIELGYVNIQCFHKDDIQIKPMGQYITSFLPSEPEHDDKVTALIDKINNDILDGKVWFEPGIRKLYNNVEIEVSKTNLNNNTYDVNILTEQYGYLYPYDVISTLAVNDQRFKIAKEIIDENWNKKEIETDGTISSLLVKIVVLILKIFN